MTVSNYSIQCIKYLENNDGTIGHYVLLIKDETEGEVEEVSVTPKHLASSRSMKRILLGRKILYSATQSEHERMLSELFALKPDAIRPIVSLERKSNPS